MPPPEPTFVKGRLPPIGLTLLRRFIGFLFWIFARVTVRGLENVPSTSGCLMTMNHVSRFDAPLVFVVLSSRTLTALVADTYRPQPFFRWMVEMVDVIWVKRGAITPTTIKAAVRALREGRITGIAPEGTRSQDTHALQPGKTGAAFLALMADVPIVPVVVTNTEHLGAAMKRLYRIPLTVTFGKAYKLPPSPSGRPDEAHLETCTTEIMCRIAALLPSEYRGVYADHPRVSELLTGDG
jgi:1-acyl-sn-glycerol-3-phosphate acyltransferase